MTPRPPITTSAVTRPDLDSTPSGKASTDSPSQGAGRRPPVSRLVFIAVLFVIAIVMRFVTVAAMGGSANDFSKVFLVGFVGVSVVWGAFFALLGHFFWRGRHDITLLILATFSALTGTGEYVDLLERIAGSR